MDTAQVGSLAGAGEDLEAFWLAARVGSGVGGQEMVTNSW